MSHDIDFPLAQGIKVVWGWAFSILRNLLGLVFTLHDYSYQAIYLYCNFRFNL